MFVDAGTPPHTAQLLIDFVNTVEWQTDEETWVSPGALADWVESRTGVVPTELTDDDLILARRFREGLREVLLTHAGHEPRAGAIDEMNALLAEFPMHLRFGEHGDATITTEGEFFLHPVMTAVHTLSTDRNWNRVKACSRDTCRWAYWDASRNQSGRWCTMAGCGNYVKMRRRNSPEEAAADVIASTGRAPRMLDVAAIAGVSMKTVSNVVSGTVRVSPATRERVEAAIEKLGYRPNLAARELRTGRRGRTHDDH